MSKNKGIIPSIKNKGEYNSSTNHVTVEDIREWKKQLDEANIPKREYIGWLLLNENEVKNFTKHFGLAFMKLIAKDKINFMKTAIILSNLTLEEKLDKWGIELIKEITNKKLDFSCGDEREDSEEDAKLLYNELINEDDTNSELH